MRTAVGAPNLDHIVLEVRDPVASVDFYRKTLGLRPVRVAAYGKGKAPFPSARVTRGCVIDFFPETMWRGRSRQNLNHFCLTYDRGGFEAVRRRLMRYGLRVEREDPHNFGALGFGRAIYFRDPDGVLVEVRHYPKPRARGA